MNRYWVALLVGLAVASACSSGRPGQAMPTIASSVATETREPSVARHSYGDAPQQFGVLSAPGGEPAPVVVLIHGGFWRNTFGLDLMEPLTDDLVDRGFAVWNIEYRRLGDPGGGWPGTMTDVAAAIDRLAELADEAPIDITRVAVVGHSAGGHLALWAGGRDSLPPDAPGANPTVVPVLAIGQGAVVDLDAAARDGLGGGAVSDLLGGLPDEHPDRYEYSTPQFDVGVVGVSVVGADDRIVPAVYSSDPDQPGGAELIKVEGANHFSLIDSTHDAWLAVVKQLDTLPE